MLFESKSLALVASRSWMAGIRLRCSGGNAVLHGSVCGHEDLTISARNRTVRAEPARQIIPHYLTTLFGALAQLHDDRR